MSVPKINIDVTAPYINGRTVGQDIHNRLTAYKALEAGTLPKKPHVLANQKAEVAKVVDTFNKQNGTNLPLPETKKGIKKATETITQAVKKHPVTAAVVVAIPLAIAAVAGIKKAVDAKKAEPIQK